LFAIGTAHAGIVPPVTTFDSCQVSGTTDTNITLSCTDNDSGCKAINYNVNNEGWNTITNKSLKDGLISYWKLDEVSGNALDAHGSYNLTQTGTVGTTTGIINGARGPFSGSNRLVSSNGIITLGGRTNLTITGWFKKPAILNEEYKTLFLLKNDGTGATEVYMDIYFTKTGDKITGRIFSNSTTYATTDITWTSTDWTFFSFTANNGVATLKLNDGTAYATSQADTGTSSNAYFAFRGNNINQYAFDGYVDEFALFNRVLSDTEISGIYNSGGGLSYDGTANLNNYSFIYSGAGDHNIQYFSTDNADNNEAIKTSQFPIFSYTNEQSQSRVKLTGASIFNGYTVTSWQYQVNGTPLSGTNDQIKYYSTQANLDLNVCLTTNSTDTYCHSVLTWDTIDPTIDANISTAGFGFTTNFDVNYNMTCSDNFPTINYKIVWNNGGVLTTIYDQSNPIDTLVSGTLDLNAGQEATLTFTCTDASNNTATYTSDPVYALLFRLINEDNGLQLTPTQIGTDFNIARVYTFDGEYSFNFKDTNATTVNFFSPTEDLWFEFGYKDSSQTKLNRQINFGLIDDQNIGVCVPLFQTFYQQRFVANSSKSIVVKNNVSDCYSVSGTLQFAYDTGYSITTYFIPKPYYLYTFIDGVKTYLALIDGGVPTQYNIDAIIFSRTGFNIVAGVDTVGFMPLLNSQGVYDTNTVQIYYVSDKNDNTKLDLSIKKADGTIIWTYTETIEPNELLVNFYWGGLDVNLDEILTLVVTTTNPRGTQTSNYYFTLYGTGFQNTVSNEWAAIIAVLFFLFGITLVAYDKALGLFGIIMGIVALFFLSYASGAWWVSLLSAAFVIIIAYIFLISRKGGTVA
jgi:hypothetical protein